MVWLVSELKKYSFDILSFSSGEPFLALLHKYDPSIVDLETFDKSDRIKALTTIFDLAEQHLNIPNLLDPHLVANNLSQKQLLLYLAIWKEKTENFEFFDGTQHIQNDIQNLVNVVEDCTYNVEILNSEFEEQCTHLKSNFRIVDRERLFDEESARLFDEVMEHAMETLTALEIKQELLLKKKYIIE